MVQQSLLLELCAIPAAGLLAVLHAGRVERPTNDLVTHARKVADAATAHQDDGVLLQVVTLARNVCRDLDAAGQAHSSDLAHGGVRLLRSVGVHASADTATLR